MCYIFRSGCGAMRTKAAIVVQHKHTKKGNRNPLQTHEWVAAAAGNRNPKRSLGIWTLNLSLPYRPAVTHHLARFYRTLFTHGR